MKKPTVPSSRVGDDDSPGPRWHGRSSTAWRRARPLIFLSVLVPQTLVLLVQGAAPVLLRDAPLVLLALHPFEPWALLVSPKVDVAPFLAIIVVVRAVPYCGDYVLGRWYGEPGLAWFRQRGHSGARVAAVLERLFARAGGLLLVLYPSVVASVLAGATGMRFRRFAPLVLLGLVLWATLLRLIATAAAGPLSEVVRLVERYAWWLVIPLVVAAGVTVLRERRTLSRADPTPPQEP